MDTHPSTHPPLPPTTEDERLSWLRLLRSRRVGIATFYKLLTEHGTANAALAALPDVAAAAGVTGYKVCPVGVVQAEMQAARQAGARMLCVGDPTYPDALLDIDDPPPILWAIGNLSVLDKPCIALVGARNASSLGTRMARGIAGDLAAEGYAIVSGLARGVDAAAHQAVLDTGTIAVMAGGVDMLYPAENAGLAEALLGTGLRISEQPMGLQPQARHFPRRNRLVSGMSRAVVVVEAAARSGSLITARNALDQGREVLAVPGHPMDARSAGCNMLIRDGAILVRGAKDVIDALPANARFEPQPSLDFDAPPIATPAAKRAPAPGCAPATQSPQVRRDIPMPEPRKRSLRETADLHSLILDRLGPTPLAEDQLIRDLGTEPRMISPALTDLELTGKVLRQAGGLISRAPNPR